MNLFKFKNSGIITAVDQETGFPAGSSIGAFRYKITDELESSLPFEISIFSTKAAGGKQKISLELEYTNDDSNPTPSVFTNISIFIKVTDEPKLIKMDDNSSSNLDSKSGMISWNIPSLSKEYNNSKGSEVSTKGDEWRNSSLQFYTTTEENTLFPLIVSFDYTGSAKSVFEIYE